MSGDDDRALVADSIEQALRRGVHTWDDVAELGWLWPADDALVLPRGALVALVAEGLGRHAVPLAYPDALQQAAVADGVGAEAARDWACLAGCATVGGLLRRLVDTTIAYVRTRQQFGQPVAGFQAVQHRLVDMHVAAEEVHALLHASARRMATPAAPLAVSMLKNKTARAARFVAQHAVQLHGAIAMTEELPVGRQVLAVEDLLARHGSVAEHTARLQQALWQAGAGA